MTTGNFWDVSSPSKPFGLFDAESTIDIQFDWAEWLTGLTDTYASHVIIVETGLLNTTSSQAAGVITARIKKDPANPLNEGSKYAVTCRITTTSGQVEDQTLYLKVAPK